MVVLADEVLESFFESDFTSTFRLDPVPMMEVPNSNTSILGGIWGTLTSDDNRKIFNRLTDEVGRTIGKHQVFHRPAIGKFTTLEEPKARESLLTPTMRRSASKASLKSEEGGTPKVEVPPSSKSAPANLNVPEPEAALSPSAYSPMPSMFEAAATAAALMERTPFAIDDARDDDDESDDETEGEEDDVMDEVCVENQVSCLKSKLIAI
jgi:TBC1 domain family member 8/9